MDVETQLREGLAHVRAQIDKFCEAQKGRTGEISETLQQLQARQLEIEQKLARRGEDTEIAPGYRADVRKLLEASADLRAVADRKSRRAVLEMPTGFFKAAIISGNGLGVAEHRTEIAALPKRRLTIRALIPSVPTTAGAVTYTRETGFTNNAAVVSETNQKPESTITFELKTTTIATIAHWTKLSLQVLSDTPHLQEHVEMRLRYGVALTEENQILKGSGVGNNLEGLYTAATAYSAPITPPSPESRIDRIRLMITQLELADFTCTGIVLNPADWALMQLTKDAEDRYIFGAPGGSNMPQMWGVPVIATSAMTADTALVGDFAQAALIFDREQDRVDISTEDEDNFQKNMATVRGEERIGLAIVRPAAMIKDTNLPAA